jgi:uncharacterized membrane protein YphA (DoxX/SURF4 family)
MKSFFSHTILILLARVFLGGIFVVASMDKISDPQAFTQSILQYKVIGPTLALGTATILPPLELLCGLSLILGVYPRGCGLLMSVMLIVFTVMVSSALIRGLDISCGCFSQDPQVSKIGYKKIVENCGLIIVSVWLFFAPNQGINLLQFFMKQPDKSQE